MRSPAARALRLGAGLAGIALAAACSHGPTWDEFHRQVAGPRPGFARIFVYTPLRAEALNVHPQVTLDGEVIGTSSPGKFFFVDRQPGIYEISIPPTRYLASFGNRAAAEPARVSLWLGQSAFVQIDVVELGSILQARLQTREGSDGERFIRECRFAPGDAEH